MMRITRISADGLKRRPIDLAELSPVVALVGPNGSGKSTALAAVTYALSGHIQGVKAGEVPLLTTGGDCTASVELHDGDVRMDVIRGLRSSKAFARAAHWQSQTAKSEEAQSGKAVDIFVDKHLGPYATTFVEAFDPGKNIWSLTPEKRIRWTFGLVAKASGWTKDKLLERFGEIDFGSAEVGLKIQSFPALSVGDDALQCIEENIALAEEWTRSSKKSVADYEIVLSSLTDAISEPDMSEIDQAKVAWRAAVEARDALQTRLSRAAGRAGLAARIAETKKVLEEGDKLAEDYAEVEGLLFRCDADAARKQLESQMGLIRQLEAHLAENAPVIEMFRAGKTCPLCTSKLEPSVIGPLLEKLELDRRETEQKLERAKDENSACWSIIREYERLAERFNELKPKIFKREVLKEQLQKFEAEAAGEAGDYDVLVVEVAKANGAADEAHAKLEELTNRQQLAKERAKKTAEQERAVKVKNIWVSRLDAVRRVREQMLEASRDALMKCLGPNEHELAPWQSRWSLDISDGGLELGYAKPHERPVLFVGMSAGEKLAATTVLMVALRRLIGKAPWSAVLIDNLEVVSLRERSRLVKYAAGLQDEIANVLLLSSDDRGLLDVDVRHFGPPPYLER